MIAAERPRRRGLIAVVLVTALLVLTMIAGGLLRHVLLRRTEQRAAERRLQAEWLAESGLDRALARLSADPKYVGEIWKLTAEDLGGREDAEVLIRIESIPGEPGRKAVHVRADTPKDETRRARRSRVLTIGLQNESKPKSTANPGRKGDASK